MSYPPPSARDREMTPEERRVFLAKIIEDTFMIEPYRRIGVLARSGVLKGDDGIILADLLDLTSVYTVIPGSGSPL